MLEIVGNDEAELESDLDDGENGEGIVRVEWKLGCGDWVWQKAYGERRKGDGEADGGRRTQVADGGWRATTLQ